jgi:hypothetical protein
MLLAGPALSTKSCQGHLIVMVVSQIGTARVVRPLGSHDVSELWQGQW